MERVISKLNARVESFWFAPRDAMVYAICRIAFACLSLLNLADLYPHRYHLFAPNGLTDQQVVKSLTDSKPYFSIFYYVESLYQIDLVFAVVLLATVCLLVGFLSRIAALICFLWYLSYTYYAFTGIHSWDFLLRIYSFVLLISPLGLSRLSLDRRLLPKVLPWVVYKEQVSRHGLLLLQLQLLVMYWQTVWLKLPDQYWRNGELMSYFLMSMYARFPTPHWASWEVLSSLMTYGTLLVEFMVPVLLFNKEYRWLGFVLGFGLHIGIMITSDLTLFSLSAMILYLPFLRLDELTDWRMKLQRLWRRP